ncbi:MAG: hypothetical protein QXI12_01865 [Candidatus Methanomethyliaceae archaeon]
MKCITQASDQLSEPVDEELSLSANSVQKVTHYKDVWKISIQCKGTGSSRT